MSCSCVLSAAESQRSTGQDQLNQHPRSEENVVEERLSYKLSKTSVVPSGCRVCGTLRSKIHMLGEVMDQVHEERIKDDASMMEDKLPLLGQLPASVSDALYPGIVFSTLSASVRVTSAGATIDRLHDMGIAISVPEGAVSSGESFDLLIRPCLCGPFQLPRKFLSSSSAYLIRHGGKSTFQKDLLIKIHHYACLRSEEDCDSMTFLSASSTPEVQQGSHLSYYTFKEMCGVSATFKQGNPVGELSLRHFCLLKACKRKSSGTTKSSKATKRKSRGMLILLCPHVQDK